MVGSQREGCHYEDLDMDGRRINWILERERETERNSMWLHEVD
jgi:hypothetical protein